MAKQTFTAGQILTAAQVTALQTNTYNQTVSAKTASYTLVAADVGTTITMNSASATTITVNTSLFSAGDTLTLTNIGAGVCTITAGTATVSCAGSLALPQFQSGTLYFTSAGVSIFLLTATGRSYSGTSSGTAVTTSSTVSSTINSFTIPAATVAGTVFITALARVDMSVTTDVFELKIVATGVPNNYIHFTNENSPVSYAFAALGAGSSLAVTVVLTRITGSGTGTTLAAAGGPNFATFVFVPTS